jgi:hypothetical protein
LAKACVHEDVRAPETAGGEREDDAETVDVMAPAMRQHEDPRGGERHPQQVAPPA